MNNAYEIGLKRNSDTTPMNSRGALFARKK